MRHIDSQEAVVSLHGVSRVYNGAARSQRVLQDVTFAAEPRSMHLLLGPSGSGKTTLLLIAAGLLRPTSGSVHLFGTSIEHYRQPELQRLRAEKIGFVFQTFRLIDTLNVRANVALIGQFVGLSRATSLSRADTMLSSLGIAHLADKDPSILSQGEKQRVGIARALFSQPRLVLADEPTACLSADQGQVVIDTLSDYAHESKACVLVASHDLRLTERADVIHELTGGRLLTRHPNQSIRQRSPVPSQLSST